MSCIRGSLNSGESLFGVAHALQNFRCGMSRVFQNVYVKVLMRGKGQIDA